MNANIVKDKLRAAGVHMVSSAIVVALAVVATALAWYPGELAYAAGLSSLVLVMAMVDIVLGPALTALVYKRGKKSLRGDLAVIVMIQLVALTYGIFSIYEARPVFVAFTVDRFEVVSAAEVERASLESAPAEYRALPRTGPRWVAVRLPEDKALREKVLMAEVLHGTGPALLPELYTTLESASPDVKARAKAIDGLYENNARDAVDAEIAATGLDRERLGYVPLTAIDRDLSVLLDRDTGGVLRVVDLRPWS